jgi:hypothetical protein
MSGLTCQEGFPTRWPWEAGSRVGTCPASQPNSAGGSIAMAMPPAAPSSGPQSQPAPYHFPPPNPNLDLPVTRYALDDPRSLRGSCVSTAAVLL